MEIPDSLLIRVLAATDATWLPNREPREYRRNTVIFERRRDFHSAGVNLAALAGSGASEAERQAANRAMRALVNAGTVRAFRTKLSKTLNYSLTTEGDAHTRALCGLPGLDLALLRELVEEQGNPCCIDARGTWYDRDGAHVYRAVWHSEMLMIRAPRVVDGELSRETRRDLMELEHLHLPMLTQGLLASNCNARGHVFYAITPAGEAALKSRVRAAKAKLPKRSPAAARLYHEAMMSEQDRLRSCPPLRAAEIGEIPLNVSPDHPRPGYSEAWLKVISSMMEAA